MNSVKVFTLLATIICLLNLSKATTSDDFVQYNHKFAVEFFQQILNDEDIKGSSFVFSPLSIQTVGGLLQAGANGETTNEILKGFSLPGTDSETINNAYRNYFETKKELFSSGQINLANKIYIRKDLTLKPTFSDIATTNYRSSVENINFLESNSAADTINKWVENNTAGKIKDFILPESINADIGMLLVNALRFKGEWETKFDADQTGERTFFITQKKHTKVQMMRKWGNFEYGTFKELDAAGINLKFKNSGLSLFLLTTDHIRKLHRLESKLNTVNLLDLFKRVSEEKETKLLMPKFKIEFQTELEKLFKRLGVTKIFDDNDADFSNILQSKDKLSVSGATHKAFIEINEEGGEAAAETDIEVSVRMGRMDIEVNSPFLYFIKSEDGEIYFMGKFTGE